jgi:F0F1-type ATP synthase membrane subunit a
MTLVSSPIVNSNIVNIMVLLSCLYLLIILESAVAFIQAYVFSILRTLYLSEVNYLKFNYLYN